MQLRTRDEGATLVEVGLVLPLLILLAVGLSEIGFLVIDYITVTNAARSGARTAAAAADDPNADDFILGVVEEAACNLRFGNLETVTIYLAEPDGSIPSNSNFVNKYQNAGPLSNLICNNVAAHALTPDSPCCAWDPDGTPRDRIPPDLDRVGVRVEFSHTSVTGIFPFPTVTWTETAVMQIEPDTRGTQ
jgi:hypothetical protein